MISKLSPLLIFPIVLNTIILNAQSGTLPKEPTISDSSRVKQLYIAANQYRSRNLDSAELDGKKALLLAKENKLVEWQARMNAVLGNILQTKGGDINNEKALQYHQESLSIYREIAIPLKTLTALTNLSNTYRKLKDYPNTLKYAIEAKELSKELSEENMLQKGIAHGTLANIYNDMGLKDSAVTNYKKTKLYLSKIKSPFQYYADSNLGSIYSDLKQYEKAEQAYETAYHGLVKTTDSFSIAKVSGSLAYIALNEEQYQKARKYYQKALQITKGKQMFETKTQILMGLAEVSYNLKNTDSALYYVDQAFYLTNSLNFLSKKSEILSFKSMIYKEQGNITEALELLEQSQILKDSIEKRKKIAESTALLIANQQEENKKETQGLYAQITQKNYVLLLAGFTLILFIILGYVFFKRKKEKLKQQVEELEKEQEEKQGLRKELDEKKREFADYVLKNFDTKDRIISTIAKEGKLDTQKLTDSVNQIYNLDKWEDFQKRFSDVHPNFYTNLQRKYTTLTNRDLNLLALISLRFSTKEIASLLNITAKGVEKARYRLRKKMNLNANQNLFQTVSSLVA